MSNFTGKARKTEKQYNKLKYLSSELYDFYNSDGDKLILHDPVYEKYLTDNYIYCSGFHQNHACDFILEKILNYCKAKQLLIGIVKYCGCAGDLFGYNMVVPYFRLDETLYNLVKNNNTVSISNQYYRLQIGKHADLYGYFRALCNNGHFKNELAKSINFKDQNNKHSFVFNYSRNNNPFNPDKV